MTQEIIVSDGPALPPKATAGPGPELLKTIEKIDKIKNSVKNNELAIRYLDCAISALMNAENYKDVQKQVILEYLAELDQAGIIKLGQTKCAACGRIITPSDKATMNWTMGKGSEIFCEECSNNREAASF